MRQGYIHLLQPLQIHPDIGAMVVELNFPKSVATASARELMWYTLIVALLCAAAAGILILSWLI
jgi:methyl-accepting chemotaxis protein